MQGRGNGQMHGPMHGPRMGNGPMGGHVAGPMGGPMGGMMGPMIITRVCELADTDKDGKLTQEEIDADLFGVRQDTNATVDLHTV